MKNEDMRLDFKTKWWQKGWFWYGLITIAILLGIATGVSITSNRAGAGMVGSAGGFKAVTTGFEHTCAISSDDKAYCWGKGGDGQIGNGDFSNVNVPTAVDTSGVLAGKTILSISAGENHTCAIASDNQAYCWGRNFNGQLGDGTNDDSDVPVAVDTSGVLSGRTIKAITAGGNFTCAIASDDYAYCWGGNATGQLGRGNTTQSFVPVAVSTGGAMSGRTVKSIAAGLSHVCIVASDNYAYCWGQGTRGQLGRNSTANSSLPVAVTRTGVLSGRTILTITSGTASSCVIANNQRPYCWGYNASGQLGNGSTTQSNVPVAVTVTGGALSGKYLVQISAGSDHVCAVDEDGKSYCWGSNSYGQLGTGSITSSSVPVAVDTNGALAGKIVSEIHAGGYHTCAITTDGSIYCWGRNLRGQLGTGNTTDSSVPVEVIFSSYSEVPFRQTSYRLYESSNTTTPGTPLAGDNTKGTLTGLGQSFRIRTGLRSLPQLSQISNGLYHSCGIDSSQHAYCWGSNSDGQLGDGTNTNSNTPVAVDTSGVLSGKTILSISAGNSHTCVIASDNNAYCWGNNGSGRLGNNSTVNSNVPVAVNTSGVLAGKTILSISVGDSHSCVVASDKNAYCWGNNGFGKLGNSSSTDSSVPVSVYLLSGLSSGRTKSISAGGTHTCAVDSYDEAYCWGWNAYGQLGNASNTSSNVPSPVSLTGVLSGKYIQSISAGSIHTCVLAFDNQVYCWGSNSNGQLGNASNTDSNVPVAVNTSGDLAGKTVLASSVGSNHSCVVASDNQVYCWGANLYGQLGNIVSTDYNVPTAVSTAGVLAGKSMKSISPSYSRTCATTSDGQAYCWGANYGGTLGTGNSANALYEPEAVLLDGYMDSASIPADTNHYRLQYSQKSATTCTEQTTGWGMVTNSSVIGFDTAATPANGSAITAHANDPAPSSPANANQPQIFVKDQAAFTNPQDIDPGNTALFDFALKENSAPHGSSFCFRLVYTDSSGANPEEFEAMAAYLPEITTTSVMTLDFVNSAGGVVLNPAFSFTGTNVSNTVQNTATQFSTANNKLRLTTSRPTGWNVSIAATGGPSALWTHNSVPANQYDFNNSNSQNGQMTINPSLATLTGSVAPGTGGDNAACAALSGVTRGSQASFLQGSIDIISLMSGSISAPKGCFFDITNIPINQTIPAYTPSGTYTIDMTMTVLES